MKLHNLNALFSALLLSAGLVSCGNKGDLFLIPDPVSQQDMQQLQKILNSDEIPTADAIDVDDLNVYRKSTSDNDDTTGMTPVDK